MSRSTIAISLDDKTISRLDRIVAGRVFPNRSRAIEAALEEKFERLDRCRLAEECSKLDPIEEAALAEEGVQGASFPEY